ncbi:MAG: Negative regulator of beta-lactamase expression [Rhodanobacteraceae bacterium]|jgi:N-acetylmuramoyl-L-alanine amidase|nr:MAG: Negative regulator of beta-lactamase expression [Rhodanobacteraceae bacterium]
MERPAIHDQLLPYAAGLQARDIADVDLVVIHCTELPDLVMAREYGERIVHASGTGNSGHYYIDRGGSVFRYVPDDRIAHHVRGHNEHSIGIELVNIGRWPDWLDSRSQTMTEPYPAAQIDALQALLAHLRTTLPNLRNIAGHEDLDTGMVAASDDPSRQVRRKLDPGPQFPWPRVMESCGLQRLERVSTPL